MSYNQRNSRSKNKIGIILLTLLIPVLFIIYKFTGTFQYLIIQSHNLSNFLYINSQKIKANINNLSVEDYKNENNILRLQLADMTYKYAENLIYKEQNTDLKSLLNFQEKDNYKYIQARVIAKDKVFRNTYILDRGSNDKVKLNNAVIVGDGNLIGRITAVKDNSSFLTLITDPQITVKVTKFGGTSPIGITKGEFGLSILVDLIPQTVALQEGDMMITSGFENELPQGLIVGKVNRILSNDNDLFQSASIIPVVNYDSLNLVSIISN